MIRKSLSLAALLMVGCVSLLPAQSILNATTDGVLLYTRFENPAETLESIARDMGLDPKLVTDSIQQLEKSLREMDKEMGLDSGSTAGFIRSAKLLEVSVFTVGEGEELPEIDFLVGIHTAKAKEVMDLLTKVFTAQGMGLAGEEGELEILAPDVPEMIIERSGDVLMMAGNRSRLRLAKSHMRQPIANSLREHPRFKMRIADGFGTAFSWVNFAGIMNAIESDMGRQGRVASRVMKGLGLFDWEEMSFREGRQLSTMEMTASKPTPLFDLFAAPAMGLEGMKRLPRDMLVAATWNGSPKELWEKGTALFLDPQKFMFAPMLREELRTMQKELGVPLKELMSIFDPGVTFGVVPFKAPGWDGETTDRAGIFLLANLNDSEAGADLLAKLVTMLSKEAGMELVQETREGRLWLTHRIPEGKELPTDMTPPWEEGGVDWETWQLRDRLIETPILVLDGSRVYFGMPGGVEKVLTAEKGEMPRLGELSAMKKNIPDGSGHLYVGLHMIDIMNGDTGEDRMFKQESSVVVTGLMTPTRVRVESTSPMAQTLVLAPLMFVGRATVAEEASVVERTVDPKEEPVAPAEPTPLTGTTEGSTEGGKGGKGGKAP